MRMNSDHYSDYCGYYIYVSEDAAFVQLEQSILVVLYWWCF